MSEILKKARQRSERAIEDLEKQRTNRDDADSEDNKHAAPWLNQLRKPSPIHPKPKPIRETPEVNGTKEEDNVPEFIRKARTLSVSHEDETSIKPVSPTAARKPPPVTAKPPPVTAKPRLPMPSVPVDNSSGNQSTESQDNKPAWMKQRERQVKMASETAAKPPPGPKPPVALPNGSPAHNVASSSPAPPLAKKPRPVPVPRGVTSPKREPASQPAVANEQGSSPAVTRVGGSVMDRARSLERGMSGSISPPPSPKGLPPKPVPPTRTTPTHQVGSIGDRSPNTTVSPPGIPSKPPIGGKPGPPPPVRREFKEPAAPPPAAAPPSPALPPIPSKRPPPPPVTPPPPSMPPPPTSAPPPPMMAPSFITAPATRGESTPRTDTVQFRRLPLQFVDSSNPPPMPSRSSKPSSPIATEDGMCTLHECILSLNLYTNDTVCKIL